MALPLKFMSAVIRKADAVTHYPGGRAAFEARHPAALQDEALYGLVTMNWADMDELLDQLHLDGFDPEVFAAVADMGVGPLKAARGIRFIISVDQPFPAWSAQGSDSPVDDPVLPRPPVVVSSPVYRSTGRRATSAAWTWKPDCSHA